MKVLQINSVCGIGSTGRIATDIHNLLLDKGHTSYIAYGRGVPQNCNTVIKIGSKFDVYSHAALTRLFDKHGFGSKYATKKFIEKVVSINPDIIHLHNIHGYYLNIEVLFNYLKEANKPVVWTLHDCWSFTGHCAYFDYIGCYKWEKGCYECPQKKSYPSSIFLDNSNANFIKKKQLFTGIKNMTLVTPSKWLAGLVKKSFLGGYPIKVINNGIDLNVFKPIDSDFRKKHNLSKKFIILGVANIWNERKGFRYFIELSRRLEADEIVIMVGLTERQKRQLPTNIIGITKTNSVEELAKIYSTADVFVNPTLEDNFPTTNIEALACGTPVITFDTGGSPEIVNKNCGFIIERGNIEELLKKIREIKNKGKFAYSSNIINCVENLYNKRNRFIEYLELYKNQVEIGKGSLHVQI